MPCTRNISSIGRYFSTKKRPVRFSIQSHWAHVHASDLSDNIIKLLFDVLKLDPTIAVCLAKFNPTITAYLVLYIREGYSN